MNKRLEVSKNLIVSQRIIDSLGGIQGNTMDVCSMPKLLRPYEIAERTILEENGLRENWSGNVWLCPPEASGQYSWVQRMAKHNNGICLIRVRTNTKVWSELIFHNASGVLFISESFNFYNPNCKEVKAIGAWALVAYGMNNLIRLKKSKIEGSLVQF